MDAGCLRGAAALWRELGKASGCFLKTLWVPVNGFRAWKRVRTRSEERCLAVLNCMRTKTLLEATKLNVCAQNCLLT